MNSIYYTLYSILSNAVYGELPQVGSMTDLAMTLLCTFLSFAVVLVPFFFAYKVLCFIFDFYKGR